jgi:Ca2+-binding EF-hand superfamily protein
LIDGYRNIFGDLAEEEVDKILARVDANGSGEIDYSGKLDILNYIL